jgi:hypothetical protein
LLYLFGEILLEAEKVEGPRSGQVENEEERFARPRGREAARLRLRKNRGISCLALS